MKQEGTAKGKREDDPCDDWSKQPLPSKEEKD